MLISFLICRIDKNMNVNIVNSCIRITPVPGHDPADCSVQCGAARLSLADWSQDGAVLASASRYNNNSLLPNTELSCRERDTRNL